MKLTKAIFTKGTKYKKAGVILLALQDVSNIQYSLFDTYDRPKFKKLINSIDNLNKTMGRDTVRYGIQGKNTKTSVQEKLSPQYTTSWEDIVKLNLD